VIRYNSEGKRVKTLKCASGSIITCICEQVSRDREMYRMNKLWGERLEMIIVSHGKIKPWVCRNYIFLYQSKVTFRSRLKEPPSSFQLKQYFCTHVSINKTHRKICAILFLLTYFNPHVNAANRCLRYFIVWKKDKPIYKHTPVSEEDLFVWYVQLSAALRYRLKNLYLLCLVYTNPRKVFFFAIHKFKTGLCQKKTYKSKSDRFFRPSKKEALRGSIKYNWKHIDVVVALRIRNGCVLKPTKSYVRRTSFRSLIVIDVPENLLLIVLPKLLSHVVFYIVPRIVKHIKLRFSKLISPRKFFFNTFNKLYSTRIISNGLCYTSTLSTPQNENFSFFKNQYLFFALNQSVCFIQCTVYMKEGIGNVRRRKLNKLRQRLKLLNPNHQISQFKKRYTDLSLLVSPSEKLVYRNISFPIAKSWKMMQHCWRSNDKRPCQLMLALLSALVSSQDFCAVVVDRNNFKHNGDLMLLSQLPLLRFFFQKSQVTARVNLKNSKNPLVYQWIFLPIDGTRVFLCATLKEIEKEFRLLSPDSNVTSVTGDKIYELFRIHSKCLRDQEPMFCVMALGLCTDYKAFIPVLQNEVERKDIESSMLKACYKKTKVKFWYFRKEDKIVFKNVLKSSYHKTSSRMLNRNDFLLTTTAKNIQRRSNLKHSFASELPSNCCYSVHLCQIPHNNLETLTRMPASLLEFSSHATKIFLRRLLHGDRERPTYSEIFSGYLASMHNLHAFFQNRDNKTESMDDVIIQVFSLLHSMFHKIDLTQIYNIRYTAHLLKLMFAKVLCFLSSIFDVMIEPKNEKELKQIFCYNKFFYHLHKTVIQLEKNRNYCLLDNKEVTYF
jgi:hypothetical protein